MQTFKMNLKKQVKEYVIQSIRNNKCDNKDILKLINPFQYISNDREFITMAIGSFFTKECININTNIVVIEDIVSSVTTSDYRRGKCILYRTLLLNNINIYLLKKGINLQLLLQDTSDESMKPTPNSLSIIVPHIASLIFNKNNESNGTSDGKSTEVENIDNLVEFIMIFDTAIMLYGGLLHFMSKNQAAYCMFLAHMSGLREEHNIDYYRDLYLAGPYLLLGNTNLKCACIKVMLDKCKKKVFDLLAIQYLPCDLHDELKKMYLIS